MALTQITEKGIKDGEILNADINASAAIQGSKITPSFTGNISVTNVAPKIFLTDSDHNSDFAMRNMHGVFGIHDQTVGADRLTIDSIGRVTIGTGTTEQILRGWTNSTDSDISGLLTGSTFGSVYQSPTSGHYVVGLRENDVADSFAIVSGGGNFSGDTTYDKLVARFRADGTTEIGGNCKLNGGNLTIESTLPEVFLQDSDSNDDFAIKNVHGVFTVRDATNGVDRLTIDSAGKGTFTTALDVTGELNIEDAIPQITLTDTNHNDDFAIRNNNGTFAVRDVTNAGDRLTINSAGDVAIGASSPRKRLDIIGPDGASGAAPGNSDTTLIIDNDGGNGAIMEFLSDNNAYGRIFFTDTDASNQGQIVYNHGSNTLTMATSEKECFKVDGDGDFTLGRDYSTNPGNDTHQNYILRGHAVNTASDSETEYSKLFFKQSSVGGGSSASIRAYRDGANYRTGLKFFTHNPASSGGDGTERLKLRANGSLIKTGDDVIIDSTNNGYGGLRIVDDSGGDYTVNYIAGRNQGATAHVFKRSGRVQGTTPWANSGSDVEFARITSGGIAFGGDTAVANVLDDYEEGTWTPSLNNAGGFGTNNTVGKYTKIGRVVHWVCQVAGVRDASSSSGTFTIGGLPFTALQATGGHGYAGCMGALYKWNIPSNAYQIGIRVPDNTTFIQFFANFDNGADSQLTSPFDANQTIFGSLSGTYITAS